MIEFKEFKIADLFTKKTVKGFSKVKEKVVYTKDGYHVFGQNIKYQFPQKVLLDSKFLFEVNPNKPIIGYASSTGSVGMISESFYRSGNNGAFQALIPKFDNYNYRHMLYLLACLRKLFSSKNYTTNINNVPEWIVKLPITSTTGKIDFQYMEDRVKALEQDRVKALEQDRVKALENYLLVTGLNNYELTDEDKKVLSYKPEFKDFKIIEKFRVKNTKSILKSQVKELSKGNTPYLTAAESNNAVFSYINCPQEWVDEGNCVFIGGKTMVVTYQEKDFCSNDSHNLALYYKDDKYRTPLIQQYFVGAIKKSLSQKYSWGDSISKAKIKKDIISLPVDESGNIDFQYMEKYIKAIQKLTIKNVVDYKNRVIDKTTKIIKY
ncbi:MAG: restriction endonuclease subunit S [Limosilactobacillus sp.]|uniref:restriction endonuclease subunit S n=1 Tax=Limosilactobacillus sp. TaxID=2773925 RepID=UPI0023C337EF|nr:restriction endonuclease subunit S [Limosilactobacillus sp.]MDE7040080.1 restriction endonuclease subunit S [Limosilactobacillus sp.]